MKIIMLGCYESSQFHKLFHIETIIKCFLYCIFQDHPKQLENWPYKILMKIVKKILPKKILFWINKVFHIIVNSDFFCAFCFKDRDSGLIVRGNQKVSTNKPERKSWINAINEIPIEKKMINLSKDRDKKTHFEIV